MHQTDYTKNRTAPDAMTVDGSPNASASPATSAGSRARRAKQTDSEPPLADPTTDLPSTPVHMTARAASRAATHSAGHSEASADSRRSSLAETPSAQGSDEDPLVKPNNLLDKPGASPNGVNTKDNGLVTNVTGDEESSRSSQSAGASPRKRKRALDDVLDSIEAAPKDSQPDQHNGPGAADAASEEPTPKRVARGRRMGAGLLAVQAPAYTPSDVSAVNSPVLPAENGEASFGTALGQAGEKPAKRLPGRRRAPHANVHIEADLRRQLSLKMGYRAIAKQLKPILAELAKRSMDSIDEDEEAHKESEHYQEVEDGLGERLRLRLDQLEHKRRYAKEESDLLLAAGREVLEDTFQNQVRNLTEDHEILAKYRVLKVLRANLKEMDADATEDEDGPIPAFRAPANGDSEGYILPSRYDSRSRLLRETERIWNELAIQKGMSCKRRALIDGDDELEYTEADFSDFATYCVADREAVEGARKRQALLEAVKACAERQAADELAAEVESRKTKDGLDILATVSEQQRLETPVKKRISETPKTPQTVKGIKSRRGSTDDHERAADASLTAPSSSKRRDSRALRSRESSPAKQATPQQPNGATTPRLSSNKISDLLNNDVAQGLRTISESRPMSTWLPGGQPQPPRTIKLEADAEQRIQNISNGTMDSIAEPPRLVPGTDPQTIPSRATEHEISQTAHQLDRRVSDSSSVRPRTGGAQPASPSMFGLSGKPTTFDGSGSTVSPTYPRQSPFHTRAPSLGPRSGSYAQETRDTVVPPQMSGRRESQRDHYLPVSVDTLPAVSSRPEDDPYSRRSEPPTPAMGAYQPYGPPPAPQYILFRGYPPPWQQAPPLPAPLAPRYAPLPAYGNEAQSGSNEQTGVQGASAAPPQEKDMWRHHSYSRGGKR